MTSYYELLRDPRWQRKRLERMEASGWACDCCGDTATTFNVHHRSYVKGRKPWEYEMAELQTLCEGCHKGHHNRETLLKAMFDLDDFHQEAVLGLIAGFLDNGLDVAWVHADAAKKMDPRAYRAGYLARYLFTLPKDFPASLATTIKMLPGDRHPNELAVLDEIIWGGQ